LLDVLLVADLVDGDGVADIFGCPTLCVVLMLVFTSCAEFGLEQGVDTDDVMFLITTFFLPLPVKYFAVLVRDDDIAQGELRQVNTA